MRGSRLLAGFIGVLALVRAAASSAEVSHHQGSNPGQISLAGVDRLSDEKRAAPLDLRLWTSFLHASERLDADARRVELLGGGSIRNYGLNGYAEVRIGDAAAVSLMTGVQRLDIDSPDAGETICSLSDTQLSARLSWHLNPGVSLIGAIAVKLPGTYPESEATGAKQIDQETKFLVAVHRLGSDHVSLVAGLGYKLRLSGIEDELTPTLLIPVRVGRLTVAPALTGGVAIGLGGQAKDALSPGLTLAIRVSRAVEIHAGYHQTLYGHNVVAAHIATLGAGARL
jgi:hypothetical protein